MAQQTIKIDSDLGKTLGDINKLNDLLYTNASAIKSASVASYELNKAGDAAKVTLEGLLATGKKFQQTFDVFKTGNITQGFKIDSTALSNMKIIGSDISVAEKNASRFNLTLAEISRTIEATAAKRAYGEVIRSLQEGTSAAIKFSIAISEIRTISQDSQISFGQLSQQIRTVSDNLGLPAADVAEAAYQAVSNQVVKAGEAFQFLSQTGEFARTTQASLADAVNLTSTVMNTYGKNVADVEDIQAQLFKTVELGRVRVNELANTYGRTLVPAHALGVAFEEVNAAMAVLTLQGVKASDAQTFLTNVFQKLLKPTTEMKATLRSFGVETGEAAVSTFKFSGVLQKLTELAKNGDVEVSKLFNEIRGRKGFQGLTNFEGEFTTALAKITDSTASYRKAVEIRAETPADFLVKEANKIKNIALNDVGQPLLAFFKDLVIGVKDITPEFLKFDGQISKSKVETLLLAGGFTLLVAKIPALVSGIRSLGLVAAANPLGLLTAGLGAVALLLNEVRDKSIIAGENLRRLSEEAANTPQLGSKTQADIDAGNKAFKETLSSVDELNRNTLQGVAAANSAVNTSLDETRGKVKALNEELTSGFRTYIDSIRNGISDLDRAAQRATQNIKDNNKRAIDFGKDAKELVFAAQLDFAQPRQKIALRGSKIESLKTEASTLLNGTTGSPELDSINAQLANDKLKEASRLLVENFKEEVGLAKENAQLTGNKNIIIVSTVKLRQQENELVELQNSLLRTQNDIQEKSRQDLRKKQQDEKDRLNATKDAAKAFTDFSILGKNGEVKTEFADKRSGVVDPDKAIAGLNDVANKVRDTIGSDGAAQASLLTAIENKKTAIMLEAAQLRAKQVLTLEQKRINDSSELIKGDLNNTRKVQQEASARIFGPGGSLEKLGATGDVQSLGQFNVKDARSTLETGVAKIAGFFDDRVKKQDDTVNGDIAKAKQQLQTVIQLITDTKNNPTIVDGVKTVSSDAVKNIREKLEAATNQVRKVLRDQLPEGVDPNTVQLNQSDGKSSPPLGAVVSDIQKKLKDLEADAIKVTNASQARQILESQKNSLTGSDALKNLQDQFPTVIQNAEDASKRVQSSFEVIGTSVNRVTDTINELNKAIQTLDLGKLKNIKPIGLGDAGVNNNDGGVEFKARGGIVGLHPGSPRGTDTIPAWLTRGEEVLTEKQSVEYHRLLSTVRMMPQPVRYFSNGGVVSSTRVGDININIPSIPQGMNTETLARNLKRTISRRGVKL